jgi:hypothetical protein
MWLLTFSRNQAKKHHHAVFAFSSDEAVRLDQFEKLWLHLRLPRQLKQTEAEPLSHRFDVNAGQRFTRHEPVHGLIALRNNANLYVTGPFMDHASAKIGYSSSEMPSSGGQVWVK